MDLYSLCVCKQKSTSKKCILIVHGTKDNRITKRTKVETVIKLEMIQSLSTFYVCNLVDCNFIDTMIFLLSNIDHE